MRSQSQRSTSTLKNIANPPITNHIITLHNDNRPYIEITIRDRLVLGLLDSGAQSSVAGKSFENIINSLNLQSVSVDTMITTADGTVHPSTSSFVAPISYNGKTKNISILYVPSLPRTLILGMDFWVSFQIRPIICDSIEAPKTVPTSEVHNLSPELANTLQSILKEMPFSKEGTLSRTQLITHHIDTKDSPPIKQRHYIVSPYLQGEINTEIDRLLKLDVIEPCEPGAWSSPIIAVKKPSGKVRLCLDARKLNQVTAKDAYPQPQINRILGRLRGTKVLSSIDLSDAFLQVPLDEASQSKTAFAVSGRGYFKYKRMAFGLCNSGATLCRLVDRVIGCDLEPFVFVYLDDIVVATEDFSHHFEILSKIAARLKSANFTISVDKSRFCMRSLRYLGYIVSEQGIRPDPIKVESIVNYPAPRSIKDTRRLVGLAGWYSRFIPEYASIMAPITDLLRKTKNKEKFCWTDKAEDAMTKIKLRLTSEPVLANPDFSKQFVIQADASDIGIGAVLLQGENDDEHVIAYWSQKLTSAQKKYHTTERECLAVLEAIDKFRPYVEGSKFLVLTDHASLVWLQNLRDPTGRLGRWALKLQSYDFDLKHRKGKYMVVADALSRAVDILDEPRPLSENDPWYNKLKKGIMTSPSKFPHFRISSEKVYKYCKKSKNEDQYLCTWRLVIPCQDRENIMQRCHNDPLSAHGGYFKTVDRVKRRYFWPKMDNDIRKFVRNCDVCCAVKSTNQNQIAPMGKLRSCSRPWEIIYLDFIGPLPRSKSGFCFVLMVVDGFSKFVHVHPLRTATTRAAIKCIEEHIFLTYGTPRYLVSDNGPQFTSTDFKKFLNLYNVNHWPTARYHPQANAAEAANKTLETSIRAYLRGKEDHRDWNVNLFKVACAMNTSRHTSTQFSPYYINFGQHMCTSADDYHWLVDEPARENEHEQLKKIRQQVKRNLEKSHSQSKKKYDLRTRPISYNIGDVV